MAAQLLRLRISLLLASARGDRRAAVRSVLGGVLLGLGAVLIWPLAGALSRESGALTTFAVLLGTAVTASFFLMPVLTRAEDPLDPRRFAVIGVAPLPLAAAVFGASFLSVPVVATAIAAAGIAASAGLGVVTAVLAVLIALATAVGAARLGFALAAQLPRRRRPSLVVVVAVLLAAAPAAAAVGALTGVPPTGAVDAAASALVVSPLAAPWALLSGGGDAWAVAVITLVVTLAAWAAVTVGLLRAPARRPVPRRAGLGWFGVMPGNPAGAIGARSMIYWLHDRRYLTNIAIVPVAALLVTLPPLVAGVPAELVALIPVPLAALFLGWLPHDDVAYDHTAIWMHVAAGVRGAADRAGRLVPILLFGTPVLVVGAVLASTLSGQADLLPALLGVSAALFLGGLGLSSIASALAPYAVTRPGDSPFRQPQRAGSSGVWSQALVLLGALAAAAPSLWWGVRALSGDAGAADAALALGLGAGLVLLVAGIFAGGAIFARRGTRLLEHAEMV
ncbi:hypothetical protein RYJ27_07635 [Microbacterium limosum]|uniref:ABC-2 type transport system permease protein n=1 Tax=Microbacterium limosum TaxID=3079935 RepID=A0AAU0MFG5_9MICO|nr:hypothetical protein [Microbacterium sp. Y20]WOQ68597.1 hypothetical protein RYJ27_07635 [Microbacterium sp. Y20]